MADSQNNQGDSQNSRGNYFDVTYKEFTKDILTYLAPKYPKNPLLNKYRNRELFSQEDSGPLLGGMIIYTWTFQDGIFVLLYLFAIVPTSFRNNLLIQILR